MVVTVVEFVLFSVGAIVVDLFKGVFSPFSLSLGSTLPHLFC